jgi:hypothetical protein
MGATGSQAGYTAWDSSLTAGETVLIAGKGHETYQIIGGTSDPFDDRMEAKAALSSVSGGTAYGFFLGVP